MTGWLIVLIVFICLLVFLLWMPIVIYIDTATSEYYIRLKGLFTARLISDPKELILIRLNVLFFYFTLHPLHWRFKEKVRKKQKRSDSRSLLKISPSMGRALLRSFKTRRFLLNFDSGDFVLNARLYPVFMLLNRMGGVWRINFQNENRLLCHIENRPVRILKAIINP